MVYLLFPGPREKLQGGFLEGFDLFSGQFSVKNDYCLFKKCLAPTTFKKNQRECAGVGRGCGSDWFICYFRVPGKSFRGDFWRVLTCFPGSFRSIFRSKFPEKIAKNPLKTLLKPFKGP